MRSSGMARIGQTSMLAKSEDMASPFYSSHDIYNSIVAQRTLATHVIIRI